MEQKKQIDYSIWLYVVIFAFSVWPLTCNYILQGEDVNYWVARIEEVYRGMAGGKLLLMPTQDFLVSFWSEGSGINTNLWLFVPALLRLLGISIVDSYRLFFLCGNLVTVLGAVWMMDSIVEKKLAKIAGVALFVLCPYRIYFCYDNPDLGKVMLWMLLPYMVGAVVRICKDAKQIHNTVIGAFSMAGMLCADAVTAIYVIGMCVLLLLWSKKWKALLAVGGGGVLFLPASVPFVRYLIKGIYLENYLPVGSIMENGYTAGKVLATYAYEEGLPGLGLGAILAVSLLLWISWCSESGHSEKWVKPISLITGVCVLAGMQFFPWDYVMRLGGLFLRLIGLMETPVMFVGFAGSLIAILGAYGVDRACESKNEFVAWIVPVAIVTATLGNYFYLCRGLMIGKAPMFF